MDDGCATPPEYAALAMGGSSEYHSESESDSRPDSPEIELQSQKYPRLDPRGEPDLRPKWCFTENAHSPTCDRPGKRYTASTPRQGGQGSRTSTTTPSTS